MAGLIEGLPDVLSLQCLARLPLSQHHSLQLVCKAWHAVVRSPELFRFRKELRTQEEWLCVCGHTPEKVWQAYDPLANRWSLLPVLPTPIANLAGYGAVGCNGKLYVIGGTSDFVDPATGEREPLRPSLDSWVFDPVVWKWSAIAPMQTPRLHFACMSHEGKIVVAGGWDAREKPVLQAEVYNPELNKWQEFPRLNEGPCPVTFGIVLDNKMRVFHKSEKLSQVYDSASERYIRNSATLTVPLLPSAIISSGDNHVNLSLFAFQLGGGGMQLGRRRDGGGERGALRSKTWSCQPRTSLSTPPILPLMLLARMLKPARLRRCGPRPRFVRSWRNPQTQAKLLRDFLSEGR
jgi:hypothetical protein